MRRDFPSGSAAAEEMYSLKSCLALLCIAKSVMKALTTEVGSLLNLSGVVVALASSAKSTVESCEAAARTMAGAVDTMAARSAVWVKSAFMVETTLLTSLCTFETWKEASACEYGGLGLEGTYKA